MAVAAGALRRLRKAWDDKIWGMQQINQSSEVQPHAANAVFRVDADDQGGTADTVKVDCGPVVFKLCERANQIPKLYVVVEGWIRIEASGDQDAPLRTTNFATRVGYFRSRGQRLSHVYGVHYDMDEGGRGHPVFHAQLRPMTDFVAQVEQRFRLGAEMDNPVQALLRTVRTPTAQMDFLSVLTQLCADHLMDHHSGGLPPVAQAFGRVRSAGSFLRGAAHRLPYLNQGEAAQCYRSSHWYGPP